MCDLAQIQVCPGKQCLVCKTIVRQVIDVIKSNETRQEIHDQLYKVGLVCFCDILRVLVDLLHLARMHELKNMTARIFGLQDKAVLFCKCILYPLVS